MTSDNKPTGWAAICHGKVCIGHVLHRGPRGYEGKQQGMFIDRHEVGQPNEFASWTDEELEAFIKSGTRPLGIVSGKTQH